MINTLQTRLAAIPEWYWNHNPESKANIESAINLNLLILADEDISYIEERIADWHSDIDF